MNQQGGKKPQTQTHHSPAKNAQGWRNRRVINLRVQSQQRTAKEKQQRQTQEKENPLKIPLPPMTQNHHDPEERQQSPSRQHDQPQIDGIVQTQARPRRDSMPLRAARQSPSVVFFLHQLSICK